LCGFGKCVLNRHGVAAAAIARGDGDLRLAQQPSLRRHGLSIWKQRNRLAAFEVANDSPLALISPPRPIVDPDNVRRHEGRAAAPADDAEESIVADRHHQAASETGRRPAAQGEREMLHDMVESSRAPGQRREHFLVKTFSEDAPTAEHRVAVKASRAKRKVDPASSHRQIGQATRISAMDSRRQPPAPWTRARDAHRADRDPPAVADIDRVIGQKPASDQSCGSNRLHGIDSLVKPLPSGASTSSKVSQSQNCTPNNNPRRRFRTYVCDQCKNAAVSEPHRRTGDLSQIERGFDGRLLSALLERPTSFEFSSRIHGQPLGQCA